MNFQNLLKNPKTNWKYILIVAILASLVGGGILAWQYWLMPEQKMVKPIFTEIPEKKLAENVVNSFMKARLQRNQLLAESYLTDNAKVRYLTSPLTLLGTTNPHFASFEILKSENLGNSGFRFIVRIHEEYTGRGEVGYFDETLTVSKINNKYFVDSAEKGEYTNVVNETADWKIYTDEERGFFIQYPPEMSPPRKGSCEQTFILYDSEEEKNRIQPIRQSCQEIAYTINGLELGISVMGNSLGVNPTDYAKWHSPGGSQIKMILAGKEAVKITGKSGGEVFVKTPSNEIIRIWYKYGRDTYKTIVDFMLSTFRFLE